MASWHDVNEPKFPWQRKRPAHYEEGMAPAEDLLPYYYEALDLIVEPEMVCPTLQRRVHAVEKLGRQSPITIRATQGAQTGCPPPGPLCPL